MDPLAIIPLFGILLGVGIAAWGVRQIMREVQKNRNGPRHPPTAPS